MTTSPSRTWPSAPSGLAKAARSRVCTLRVPRAGNTVPAKLTSTPRSRAAGLAATEMASARLRGPSVSGTSAARWAPVRTTGRGSACTRSSRIAVSSRVSVPWVTTMPSTSSRASCPATASLTLRRWSRPIWYDPIRSTSCASTRRSSTASSSGPPRVVASSVATTAPPGARRDEMVPPVVSRTTRGTEPPIGRAGWSRGSSVKHGARRPGQWPCGWSRPPSGLSVVRRPRRPRRGCRPPRTRLAAAPPPLAARADRGPSTAVRRSAAPAGATAGPGTAAQHPDRHGPQPRWGRPARASAHALVWVLTPRTRWTRRREPCRRGACTGAPTPGRRSPPLQVGRRPPKVESEPHRQPRR